MRYKFQYQFIMKKSRPDKCHPQAITLSSKRASLNQDQLFVPYKIDWKNSPLQSVENNSSRAFFQNMKAQLSNIKNDFEKLIKKQGPLHEKDEDFKSAGKPKCQSAYKKDVKKVVFDRYPENEKLEIVMNNKEDNDHFFKILNLEKNLPCSSGQDYKHPSSKTVNIKDFIAKEAKSSPFEAIQIQRNQRTQSSRGQRPIVAESARTDEKDKEIISLKDIINTLQSQLKETKNERDFTSHQAQRLFSQNNTLIAKITDLSNELGFKIELAIQQQARIKKLSQDLRNIEEQCQQRISSQQQFNNQRSFYNEKINQLMFHNQNLGGINMQLGEQNQILKENCSNLQRFIEDLQKRGESISADNKRKLQYIQRDIQQYQKREDMFSKEIEKLNFELMQAHQAARSANIQTCESIEIPSNLTQDELVSQLQDQIRHLKQQVNIQKEIHSTLSKRYEQQIASLKIEQISRQFQQKINKLIDENAKLKTKINLCQSSFESIKQQNQSYLLQIQLYEERDKIQSNKQLTPTQWQELTQQIDKLREQNKRLSEQLQYKCLRQESEQTSQLLPASCDSLIRMANMQLFENERLKETIKELSSSLKNAEQRIQSLTLSHSKYNEIPQKINTSQLGKRIQILQAEVQRKNGKVKGMKDLVFKVLIEKTNKLQDQDELQYYLKEIQAKKQLFEN